VPFNILITTTKFPEAADYVRAFLRDHDCALIEHDYYRGIPRAEQLRLVADADGYITYLEPVDEEVFAAAPRLRVVSAGGVGYDHIDLAAATRHGAAVCICAGCNNHAVSELALGMMLALARQILPADRAVRDGRWPRLVGPELWGKTLGIVGLGRVGKSVALIGRGLGMRVLATDIQWDVTFANEHQVSYVPLPRLMREADFVSLHCPLTPQTRHLMNAERLALLKPTAYLINTARGPIVEESALVAALRAGRLAGAGLDVFATEPHAGNPYTAFPNVVLTPHLGGATHEATERSLELALLNVTQVLTGGEPICRVN
jgi:phosphoglycerate dehydrogenase-like enzyme